MLRRTFTLTAGAALVAAALAGASPALAQGKKIVIAVPGIPPVYSVTIAYVAEKQGFFKKHGANVEIKPFDNGTAAARAVVAGDIDLAWSPTPPVINQVSNAGVPLVAVYGMHWGIYAVMGIASTITQCFGTLYDASRTRAYSSSAAGSGAAPGAGCTTAVTASPHRSSGRPITATCATLG